MAQINRTELLQALAIVKPGLASKEIIDQSTSFAFIDGRVVTYNDEISLSHPVSFSGITGAIKADELYLLLNKTKSEEIEMDITETEILLKIGRAKAGLTLQKEILLPLDEVADKGKWKELPENFAENLKLASQTCAKDLSTPLLTCIHVRRDGTIEACDNYSAIAITGDEMPVDNFLLPASAAAQVIRLNPTKISTALGWVHFRNKEKTILSCRVYEEAYPDISAFFKVKGTKVTLPENLAAIVDTASIFSKRDHISDEAVTIRLKENRIVISGKSDTGWYREDAKIKYSGEELTFSISPYLLSRFLSHTRDCLVGASNIQFHHGDWNYSAMLQAD